MHLLLIHDIISMDSGLLCEFVYRMAGRESVNSEFELIRYNDNLPARIDIKQGVISTTYHWHKEIELVYVMDGAVTIKINTQDRSLHADEFVLMNSAENHSLSSEDAKCLILDISYEFAEQFDSSLYSSSFKIVSGSGAEEEIHNLLWQLSRTPNEPKLADLRQYALITELLHVLFVQCNRKAARSDPDLSERTVQRNSRHAVSGVSFEDPAGACHGCAAQQAHDHRGSCQGRRIPEQAHLYRKMQKRVSHHSFSALEAKKGNGR